MSLNFMNYQVINKYKEKITHHFEFFGWNSIRDDNRHHKNDNFCWNWN